MFIFNAVATIEFAADSSVKAVAATALSLTFTLQLLAKN